MPPRNHEDVGSDRAEAAPRGEPRPRREAVDDALGRDGRLEGILALVELRGSRKEESGIEPPEGDDRDVMALGECAREERCVVRDAAAIRMGGAEERDLHAGPGLIATPRGRRI